MTVIEGDSLEQALDSATGVVEVRPSPTSWRALKPKVLGRRGTLKFMGYPACAIGSEYRNLPVSLAVRAPYHAPCARCAVRAACSPPHEWNDELQPFRGGDPNDLWGAWHERLARTLGIARDPRLDAMVRAHVAAVTATAKPLTLEPSIVVGDRIEPSVRLAVFHGHLPTLPGPARATTMASLEGVRAMADIVGTTPPADLLSRLADLAPFRAPVGFEAIGDRILLKVYLELEDRSPEERRAIVRLFAPVEPQAGEVVLVGLSFDDRLRSVKAYLRGPTEGAPPGLLAFSSGRALRVVDLLEGKPAKWDFDVRRELLSGTCAPSALRDVVPGAAGLTPLLAHHDFRTDCVAIGERDGRHTLYLDLA